MERKNPEWLDTLAEVGARFVARLVPLLLAALLGALTDAQLLEGQAGETAARALFGS